MAPSEKGALEALSMLPPASTAAPAPLDGVPAIKAYKSSDFLTSSAARHIRIMCELQEPAQRLAAHGVDNYFLVAGSHLAVPPEERREQIGRVEQQLAAGGPRDEMEALRAKLRFHQRLEPMDRFYVVAMELAEKIARWSLARKAEGLATYHVCTGGGPGIMEAANRGARAAGDLTLGLGSTRPEWGQLNEHVSREGAFEFHYFFMKKYWMAYKCMGLVVLPGGLGCLDELFELLMLVSSKKITHRLPIILVGREHWRKAINWDYLVETGMVSQDSIDLIQFLDTADEAFEHLQEQVRMNDRDAVLHGEQDELPAKRLRSDE